MPAAFFLEDPFLGRKTFQLLTLFLICLLFLQPLLLLRDWCRRGCSADCAFGFPGISPFRILIGTCIRCDAGIRPGHTVPLLIFSIGVFPGDTHFYYTFHMLPPLFL